MAPAQLWLALPRPQGPSKQPASARSPSFFLVPGASCLGSFMSLPHWPRRQAWGSPQGSNSSPTGLCFGLAFPAFL